MENRGILEGFQRVLETLRQQEALKIVGTQQARILGDIRYLEQMSKDPSPDFTDAVVKIHTDLSALVSTAEKAGLKKFWEKFQEFRVQGLSILWASLNVTPLVSHEASRLWVVDILSCRSLSLKQWIQQSTIANEANVNTRGIKGNILIKWVCCPQDALLLSPCG